MSPTTLPSVPSQPPPSALARLAQRRPWVMEWLYFLIALGVYQLSRAIAIGGEDVAMAHAMDIVHFERALGVYVEPATQALVLPYEALKQVLNAVYMRAHLPVTILFFMWLYRYHRSNYAWVRNGFFVANAIAVIIYVVYPVAPPRLMEALGIVDTLRHSSGVDLYRGWRRHFFNQYAAVPSMHFGYSLLVSTGVVRWARPLWVKAVGILYAPLILLVIVVTGNHFVMDAAAGGLVMALAFVLLWQYQRFQTPALARLRPLATESAPAQSVE